MHRFVKTHGECRFYDGLLQASHFSGMWGHVSKRWILEKPSDMHHVIYRQVILFSVWALGRAHTLRIVRIDIA
jgi:hypothetical protein